MGDELLSYADVMFQWCLGPEERAFRIGFKTIYCFFLIMTGQWWVGVKFAGLEVA